MPTNGMIVSEFTDAIADATELSLDDEGQGFGYCFDPAAPRSFPLLKAMNTSPIDMVGGEYFTWRCNYRDDGSPAHVLAGQTYAPVHKQIEKKFTLSLTKTSTHYTILDDEVKSNRKPEQLVDFVTKRRRSAKIGHAIMVENDLWADHPRDTDKYPHSLMSWIVPVTTAQLAAGTGGGAFQGVMPYEASTLAGQTLTASLSRLLNYNFAWSNTGGVWTDTDEANAAKMFMMLGFEAPPVSADLQSPTYAKRQIYVDMTMFQSMALRAKQQNDQVGSDLAAYQNSTLFLGLPPRWQIQLDTASLAYRGYHPFVMVDWSAIRPVIRKGDFFRPQVCTSSSYQPDATTSYIWLTWNLAALSRQRLGIGSYPTV